MAAVERDDQFEPDAVIDAAPPPTTELFCRETLCFFVGIAVLVSGILVSTGLLEWHLASLREGSLWSILATVIAAFVPGLFFKRTRKICGAIILGIVAITAWSFFAGMAGYGWYVFFSSGMSFDGAYPLMIPKSGAALLLLGLALLTICVAIHGMGDAGYLQRAGFILGVFAVWSAVILLLVTVHYGLNHASAEAYDRQRAEKAAEIARSVVPVTSEQISSIIDCRHGSVPDEVICRIPTPKSDPKTNGMNHD